MRSGSQSRSQLVEEQRVSAGRSIFCVVLYLVFYAESNVREIKYDLIKSMWRLLLMLPLLSRLQRHRLWQQVQHLNVRHGQIGMASIKIQLLQNWGAVVHRVLVQDMLARYDMIGA